jgi:hypothetical protein
MPADGALRPIALGNLGTFPSRAVAANDTAIGEGVKGGVRGDSSRNERAPARVGLGAEAPYALQ